MPKVKTHTTLARIYDEMLGVLPPAAMLTSKTQPNQSGFLVGEPTDHTPDGLPRYASYFQFDDQYAAGPNMTVKEFTAAIEQPETTLRDNEETPDNVQTELELYESHSPEAVAAYLSLNIEQNHGLNNFEEAYTGEYDSDEEFAQDMAEQLGSIEKDVKWPYTCIDWEHAARELMYDYSDADGFYFRNL